MTTEGTAVEGGLDEPTELEPAQGTLQFAHPEDRHTRKDWERETAKALRKARRMSDDDPDALVWDKLTRSSLDAIALPPLGTPALLEDLQTAGRPTRAGEWDIRSFLAAGPREGGQRGGARATSRAGSPPCGSRPPRRPTSRPCSRGSSSTWRPPCSPRPTTRPTTRPATRPATRRRPPGPSSTGPATSSCTPAPTSALPALRRRASRPWPASAGCPGLRASTPTPGPRPRGLRRPGARLDGVRRGALPARRPPRRGCPSPRRPTSSSCGSAVTDEQFTSIAKLRAAHRLWARLQELSGSEPVPARLHAVTSRPMMTALRPLGEHAAHDGRRVRRGRRRCRLGHGPALRQRARPARRLRPPDRAQHLPPAHQRVPRRPGHRPRRRLLRGREAHPRPRGRRVAGSSAASRRAARATPGTPRSPTSSRRASSRSPPASGR